jgi:membrane protein required for colicin V production
MTWVDWAIVAVLVASVVGGLAQGFFRSICSLGGLVFGLLLASWNYWRIANLIQPLVRNEAVSDAVGFILIMFLVIVVANLIGNFLGKTLSWMGLGCLDMLAGGIIGFFEGAFVVMLGILITVAFFPKAEWLVNSRLPSLFFSACHLSVHATPAQLAEKVLDGLRHIENETPHLLHPPKGVS